MPRLAPRAFLLVACAVALLASPVAAERQSPAARGFDDPPTSSSTSSSTSSTSSTTSTTAPPSTTSSVPPDPADPGAGGDITGGQVPDDVVEVPPPDDTDTGPHQPSVAIVGDLASARDRLATAEARVAEADAHLEDLSRHLSDIDARLIQLTDEERRAVKRVEEAQNVLAERAVSAYMRGNEGDLEATLAANDPNEASRNAAMMESVLDADNHAVDDYRAARRQVSEDLVDLADERQTVLAELIQAKDYDKAARADVVDARVQLAAFEAGSEIFVTGMVFPVDDPHDYIDSWLFPRSGGRQHQGIDIFAPVGTNLFAVERGVVAKVGNNTLGGIKLWIYGESGTTYYYAHLRGYAPGIRDGLVVDAGDVVGFVGNTGNAATTPSHLHFEIHPNNGPAVNPTPLLRVVDALDDEPSPTL